MSHAIVVEDRPRVFSGSRSPGSFPPTTDFCTARRQDALGKACCNTAHGRLQEPVVSTELQFCKLGHPLSGNNVVVENRNGREFKRCRTCRREAGRGKRHLKVNVSNLRRANGRSEEFREPRRGSHDRSRHPARVRWKTWRPSVSLRKLPRHPQSRFLILFDRIGSSSEWSIATVRTRSEKTNSNPKPRP